MRARILTMPLLTRSASSQFRKIWAGFRHVRRMRKKSKVPAKEKEIARLLLFALPSDEPSDKGRLTWFFLMSHQKRSRGPSLHTNMAHRCIFRYSASVASWSSQICIKSFRDRSRLNITVKFLSVPAHFVKDWRNETLTVGEELSYENGRKSNLWKISKHSRWTETAGYVRRTKQYITCPRNRI